MGLILLLFHLTLSLCNLYVIYKWTLNTFILSYHFFLFQIRKWKSFFFYFIEHIEFITSQHGKWANIVLCIPFFREEMGIRNTIFIMEIYVAHNNNGTRTVTLSNVRQIKFFGNTSQQGMSFTILLWIVPMFSYNLMCMACICRFLHI